jgi:2-keto-4-pentenoate hydratase/2-oxohepta-3-ene-1,7-dioic acid hydratase in catechol pathway
MVDYYSDLKPNEMLLEKHDRLDLSDVLILAPVEHPERNIFCIGKNYAEHALELEGKTTKEIEGLPDNPIYFSKIASPALGHNGKIKLHQEVTKEVDYEVELGVVIGKTCKNITEDEVKDYIFGYTIINDVTARDLQRKHIQWLRGKSLDTFCPMGPVLVTKDEIKDHSNLEISLKVNDDIRQTSNTSKMIFSIEKIISELSSGITLLPGDVIATGTPEGVGMGFVPPKYLKVGDVVTCTVESIGELTNYVTD